MLGISEKVELNSEVEFSEVPSSSYSYCGQKTRLVRTSFKDSARLFLKDSVRLFVLVENVEWIK